MVFSSGATFSASRMLTHSSSGSSKRKNDNSSTNTIKKSRKSQKKTNFFNKEFIDISGYKRELYYYELIQTDDISSHKESERISDNSNKKLLSDIFTLNPDTTFVIQNINCSNEIPGNVDEKCTLKNMELSIFENEDYDNPRRIYVGSSTNSLYNCNIKIYGSDIKKFQLYAECDKDLTDISIYFEGDIIRKDTN